MVSRITKAPAVVWTAGVVIGATLFGQVPAIAAPPTTIVIQTLHDAGGLDQPGATGQTLNVDYTAALQKYLAGAGTLGHFTVAETVPTDAPLVFTLEGDLSHISQPTHDGGPYLCVLRLYQEGAPRQLVGQWTGVAESLRYLTGNLRSTPGISTQGLLGELGRRLVATIASRQTDDQAQDFSGFVASVSQTPRLTAEWLFDPSPALPKSGKHSKKKKPLVTEKPVVPTSAALPRLRVTSQDAGTLTLVGYGADGRPQALTLAVPSVTVAAGTPTLVPFTLALPGSDSAKASQIIVLIRRKLPFPPNVAPVPPGPTPLPMPPAPIKAEPDAPLPVLQAAEVQISEATLPPPAPLPSDPALADLLKTAATDPPGTWAALTMTVPSAPPPKGH